MTNVHPARFADGALASRTGSAAPVTDIATRRRSDDVIASITCVLGGVNYGTIPLGVPYEKGKAVMLYVVPADREPNGQELSGPLDCLITDDASLAYGKVALP